MFKTLNNITKKQKKLTNFDIEFSKLPVFIFNRMLSSDKNLLTNLINYVNRIQIDNEMWYDLMYEVIPKTNKFFKYNFKKTKENDNLKYIQKYFQVRDNVAKQYLEVLSKGEVKEIKQVIDGKINKIKHT